MALSFFMDLLKKIDPARLRSRFPDKRLRDEFHHAIAQAKQLYERLGIASGMAPEFSPENQREVERVAALLRDISSKVDDATEIGSRSRAAEAVVLYSAGFQERAIYLAGVAKSRNVREPYATQLQVLPADACVARYRQINRIREIVARQQSRSTWRETVLALLDSMQASLACQFETFAYDAYTRNPHHPYAAYMRSLTLLLQSHRLVGSAEEAVAPRLVTQAESVIANLPEPKRGDHASWVRCHMLNYAEFRSFRRLSSLHSRIQDRLEFLSKKADELLQANDGGLKHPREEFGFIPLAFVGARYASLLGIAYLIADLAGVEPKDLAHVVDQIWAVVARTVDNNIEGFAMHGGGVAQIVEVAATVSVEDSMRVLGSMGSHGGGIF